MSSASHRTRALTLTMTRLALADACLLSVRGTCCDRTLNVHQPDLEDPGRLLGVCPGCGRWSAIRIEAEGFLLLLELPECPETLWEDPDAGASVRLA